MYKNGEFVKEESAYVSIRNKTFNYGLGALEGIRAYWNEGHQQLYLFRLKEHYQRLLHSCKALFIMLPYSVEELCEITIDLLRKNQIKKNIYIRPIAYINEDSLRPRLYKMKYGLAIFTEEIECVTKPMVDAVVSSWLRIENNTIPPSVKSIGGYLNSALAYSQAITEGYDEAILLNLNGTVSEASTNNIFMVTKGKLYTPTIADNILEGITRDTVINIANQELKLEVKEVSIPKSNLYWADEVFMTGTAVEILPVASIDNRPINNREKGPITNLIQQKYQQIIYANDPARLSYCTPVYTGS